MKKLFTLFFVLLIAFAGIIVIAACSSPPPPVEAPPPPPPPPPLPPPPPPPPPEPEEEPPDTSPPEISISLSPQPFSPDGDGVDDLLTVNIDIKTASPIYGWHIEIREPLPPYLLFSEWSGDGMPDETIIWDGLSATGELVQSASEYHFAILVTNIYNESSVYQGDISVDVLVQREGEVLRVIVPSIVFAPNAGDFKGLDPEAMEHNDLILRRIAEILGNFETYRVKVEGHANPTTAPGTTRRNTEETRGLYRGDKGLQPLSEERAKAVVDYLVGLGVAQDRLTFVGAGSSRTVAAFEDRDNWWKNRRVEFILEKPAN
jgi:flagellar motor protein MotB